MTWITHRFAPAGLLVAAVAFGGLSVPRVSEGGDHPHGAASRSPRFWSAAWWTDKAERPVGARQVKKYGKLWPPYPRPAGKQQHALHRYHAAHYWPYPYNCQDRAYVRMVSQQQVESGWTTATTLYDYHFDADTQELNPAGLLHLRWILEEAPVHRRLTFVQSGASAEISELRLAGVREEAAEMIGEEHLPPIVLRAASPAGRPALEINRIRLGEIETMPEPRVRYESLPTTTR